jgi:hypothetical protein
MSAAWLYQRAEPGRGNEASRDPKDAPEKVGCEALSRLVREAWLWRDAEQARGLAL